MPTPAEMRKEMHKEAIRSRDAARKETDPVRRRALIARGLELAQLAEQTERDAAKRAKSKKG